MYFLCDIKSHLKSPKSATTGQKTHCCWYVRQLELSSQSWTFWRETFMEEICNFDVCRSIVKSMTCRNIQRWKILWQVWQKTSRNNLKAPLNSHVSSVLCSGWWPVDRRSQNTGAFYWQLFRWRSWRWQHLICCKHSTRMLGFGSTWFHKLDSKSPELLECSYSQCSPPHIYVSHHFLQWTLSRVRTETDARLHILDSASEWWQHFSLLSLIGE